jgi:sulfoxide reductase heme-binding subunit YedZ
MIPPAIQMTAASNGKALWYLTRSTGTRRSGAPHGHGGHRCGGLGGLDHRTMAPLPLPDLHRNLSLFCVAFVAVHVVTTVSDGYVPIGFADAFIPLLTQYRPVWIGLGALAFDLLLVVMATSALRHRIGYASWRFVHWLAYLCWPIAMFHSLGSGSDSTLAPVLLLDAVCAAAVLAAVVWRLSHRSVVHLRKAGHCRGGNGDRCGCMVVMFAAIGPLRPDWSHRAGTSTALLAQLAHKYAAVNTGGSSLNAAVPTPTTDAVPTAPFTSGLTGAQTATGPDAQGNMRVNLTMHLQNSSLTPLTVVLSGTAAPGGGIVMSSGSVNFGGYHGLVAALNGTSVVASVAAPDPETLRLELSVDQGDGAISGTVTATSIRWRWSELMTTTSVWRSNGDGRRPPPPPPTAERLLSGLGDSYEPVSLDDHLARWGSLPEWRGTSFIGELDRSGLRGHGGAWFPVGAKWRSVRRAGLRSPVVVANGAESEPASGKDRLLLGRQLPHLVLDGAALAAAMRMGASRIVLVHVPFLFSCDDEATPSRSDNNGASTPVSTWTSSPRPIDFWPGRSRQWSTPSAVRNPATPSFVTLRSVRERGVDGRPDPRPERRVAGPCVAHRPVRCRLVPSDRNTELARHRPPHRHRALARTPHRRSSRSVLRLGVTS